MKKIGTLFGATLYLDTKENKKYRAAREFLEESCKFKKQSERELEKEVLQALK